MGSPVSVFGVAMVRDEVDIIGPVVAHMLGQVDHVIVADNLSVDGTFDLLESFGSQITLIADTDPAYRQSEKMTHLAGVAQSMGADWVVPFDADEWIYSPHHDTITECLTILDRYSIVESELYNHLPTAVDPDDPNPIKSMGWRFRKPGQLPKVACRTDERLTIHMGNHGADYGRFKGRTARQILVTRHFPYRSPEQFVRKAIQGAEALRRTDLPESAGAHWRQYADLHAAGGDEALHEVFRTWFWSDDPASNPDLIFDPAP